MNNKKNIIDVIIPTYNRENFIVECISSLINQTLDKELYRIIVLDNCSTDNTIDILKTNFGDSIEIIKNDINIGMVNNWNKAIELSKSKYLAIFHSDEVFHNQILEFYLEVMNQYNFDVLSSAISYDRGIFGVDYDNISVKQEKNYFANYIMVGHGNIQITNAMFKRNFIQNNKFDINVRYYTDAEWQYRVYKNGFVGFIENKLTYTKIGEHQISEYYWKAIKYGIVNDDNKAYLIDIVNETQYMINTQKKDKDFIDLKCNDEFKNEYLARKYTYLSFVQFLICDTVNAKNNIYEAINLSHNKFAKYKRLLKLILYYGLIPKNIYFIIRRNYLKYLGKV